MTDEPHDFRSLVEAFLDEPGSIRVLHCPEGCLLAVASVGCEHGHAVGSQDSGDLEAISQLVTIAGRLSAYYDALVNAGFVPLIALELTSRLQTALVAMLDE